MVTGVILQNKHHSSKLQTIASMFLCHSSHLSSFLCCFLIFPLRQTGSILNTHLQRQKLWKNFLIHIPDGYFCFFFGCQLSRLAVDVKETQIYAGLCKPFSPCWASIWCFFFFCFVFFPERGEEVKEVWLCVWKVASALQSRGDSFVEDPGWTCSPPRLVKRGGEPPLRSLKRMEISHVQAGSSLPPGSCTRLL